MTPDERALALAGSKALLAELPVPDAARGILGSAIGLVIDTLESGHPDPEAAIEALRNYHRTELLGDVGAALRARFAPGGR